jgi:hypothetical protein
MTAGGHEWNRRRGAPSTRTSALPALGLYLSATTGRIQLKDGSTFDLGSAKNVQAMILLHEPGHELKEVTGFTEDRDAATNSAHTKRIINACFQKQKKH